MRTDRRWWRGQRVRVTAMSMVAAAAITGAVAMPQGPPSLMLPENQVTRVSDHVYAIMGFPNIGIVVGTRATLVVDTGLGPRNGAIAAREAQKLAKGPVLYLTTTHYHAEHAAGDNGFPENTILVRPIAQQKELEERGSAFVQMFSNRSAQMKELLADTRFRTPDITFEKELTLDLGGVSTRLFWLGQAHTKGDEMINVKPDSVLIAGDIVQNKMVPNLPDENASLKGWLDILSQLRLMKFKYIVPDHGALGDGSLIEQDFQFVSELQKRALELKKQGKSADQAGQTLSAEFKTRFPDWQGLSSLPNVVNHVYAENP
jgi:glyoxylase-like metal-dependent hydrolase (beta-lactamase superfamily II)